MPKSDRATQPPRVDEPARRAICEDLGTTILVEAAAGTGKTGSLVDRMVALVAAGTTTVDRLSAVTFTIKAANQLRQRFQNALEARLRDEGRGDRRTRLRAALSNLDSCFVGTIHAFAARLLRERPIEAGVDPGFREMDEPEDGVARGEAWNRYAQALFLRGDSHLARLLELGVSIPDLRQAYDLLCENSDVEPAIGPQRAEPDFASARQAVEAFLEKAAASLPSEAPPGGWNDFQRAIGRARRLWDLLDVSSLPDFVEVLKTLRAGSATSGAGAWRKSLEKLREEVVRPALTKWEEFLYPPILTLLDGARREYDGWRRQNARLNFQDLLLLARNLLRDFPPVRRALKQRFTPILVDEFQDTDPIQAEILFYLTGEDDSERDWRRIVPAPGSLFVVGDPKQSIYRFRRADIETYDQARRRIAGFGRVVELSTNFRSTPDICQWVNGVFGRSEFFPAASSPDQAAWSPLTPERTGAATASVFRLEIKTPGRSQEPAAAEDARRVADAILSAVARGERAPGDFLILFRRRKYMTLYASELESRAIPAEIGGGGAFGDSEELEVLMPLLRALADPDDPVPWVATLRGPLFGIDDEALYGFVRAGGKFHFRNELPSGADARICRATELLLEAADLVETLPPAAAIARLTERLGWIALAASRELGETRAGNLLKALAAARKFSSEGRDFAGVVDELDRMRGQDLIEQMSLDPGRSGVVRLLTLHGAKGLESPVVFLADPTGDSRRPRDYVIDRNVEPPVGYLRVARKKQDGRGDISIARPPDWAGREEIEQRFERSERVRLLYVAATRAREQLIVSIWRRSNGQGDGPWSALDPYLPTNLPERAADVVAESVDPLRDIGTDHEAARLLRGSRRELCGTPSFSVASVTALSHAQAGPSPARSRTGHGMEWGRIVHRLLEALMRDPTVDKRLYAENLYREEQRLPDDLDQLVALIEEVQISGLWRRALSARRRLVEVPFALTVPSSGLPGSGNRDTILQGAIDLAFEEEDGWVVVDYKSDIVSGNLAELAEFYKPQVTYYRRYWERLTGRKTKAGLFFIETGEELWLS